MSGEDWFLGFRKRHQFSLRKAENTSIGRAIGFNQPAVQLFFDNLIEAMSRHSYGPQQIYNVDETGVSTVPSSSRVVAKTGSRSVGRIVSAERGTLVTLVCAINAIGNSIPPMFIFPRKNFKDHFIFGAPPGSTGVANGSGWIKEENWLEYVKHFIKFSKPSAESPVLLLLDNHVSHLYIPAIDLCKENHITLLSLPPHTSHKLQPLDRVVYGPLKTYIGSRCHAWTRENPGKVLSIYDIPGIVGSELPRAMTQHNIIESFRCTGIWPVNRHVFTDRDYAAAEVTDRPMPTEATSTHSTTTASSSVTRPPAPTPSSSVTRPPASTPSSSETRPPASTPSSSETRPPASTPSSSETRPPASTASSATSPTPSRSHADPQVHFSPELVMPYPSAQRKSTATNDRRRRRSAILTDSPVKSQLQAAKKPRPVQTKRGGKISMPRLKTLMTGKGKQLQPRRKAPSTSSSSSDDEENICLVCAEHFDDSRSGENWVQCSGCKMWAHEDCSDIGSRSLLYVCQNCLSD
ncbi:tigger transposable element-derived protein 6-like protein [Elysia marginata]|uniref:Tigger transposable element-derived protein 6-like protein n=1 Tax=Elysia marginata TaxID=1093978 RepID=A0AAV4JU61_9GAST|nr:tigger transposable element-derived protein 6-like protein [Elysia marginata]